MKNVFDNITNLEDKDDISEAILDEDDDMMDDAQFLSYLRVNSKNELLNLYAAFISNSPLNMANKKDNTKALPASSTKTATENNTNQSIVSHTTTVSEITTDETETEIETETEAFNSDHPNMLPPKPSESIPVPPDESIQSNKENQSCNSLISALVPIPISAMAKIVYTNLTHTYTTLTIQEKRTIDSCTNILIRLLPHLTFDVYEGYTKKMEFALAEAKALALYNNAKHSELARETNKIVSVEQSVNAPIVKSMINEGIDFKLKQLQNKIDNLTMKNKKAKEDLKDLKGQACSKNQLQTAPPSVSIMKTTSPPPSTDSISSVSTTELKSCLKRKHDEKHPLSPEEELKRKERKRLRNQRQRANRLKRKEAQGDTAKEKTNGNSKL